jgi:hypothetical protein
MDLLFTLLLCSAYPALGLHVARTELRTARHRPAAEPLAYRELPVPTWLYVVAMVPLWPAVELIPTPRPAPGSRSGQSA